MSLKVDSKKISAFITIGFLLIAYSWPYASNSQEFEIDVGLEGSNLHVSVFGEGSSEGWGHIYGANDLINRDISLSIMGEESTLNQCTSPKEFYGLGDHLEYEISKSIFETKVEYDQAFSMNSDIIVSMVNLEEYGWISDAKQFLHGSNGKILILVGAAASIGEVGNLKEIFKIDVQYDDQSAGFQSAMDDMQYSIVNENQRILAANKIFPDEKLSFGKFEIFIVGGSMIVIAPCMFDGKFSNDESGMASDIVKLISSGILQRYSMSNTFLDESFRDTYIFVRSFENKLEYNLENSGFENFRYIRIFMHNNDIINPRMFLREIVNPSFSGYEQDFHRSGFLEPVITNNGNLVTIEISGLRQQNQTNILASSEFSGKNIVMHFPRVTIFCDGLGGGLNYQMSVKNNLENMGYNISVYDDEGLTSLLNSGRHDFTLLLMGSVLPDRVYSAESNLLRGWIDSGGNLIWIGDKFLYSSYDMLDPESYDLSSPLNLRDQSQIDFFGREIIPERFDWKEEVTGTAKLTDLFNLNFSYAPWGIGLEQLEEIGGVAIGKTGGGDTERSSVSLLHHGNGSIVHFGGCPTRWLHHSDMSGDIHKMIDSGAVGILKGNGEIIELGFTELYVRNSYEFSFESIDFNKDYSILINGEIYNR